MKRMRLRPRWVLLSLAVLLGLALRVVNVQDMEYKEDEIYNYDQSQKIGRDGYWPWVGIASGVYVKNPGASIWVFAGLARLTGATTPTELARALQVFNVLALLLLLPLGARLARTNASKAARADPAHSRELWDWILAWALVNPFWIYYARKLWPEGFLPAVSIGMLLAWISRRRFLGAFAWGISGALLGQIHMSGFFMAAGLAGGTALLKRSRRETHWLGWFAGSCMGALPLIPWIWDWFSHPPGGAISVGIKEAVQLKYWVFWLTQPLGLHLGNVVGVYRGPSHWNQLSDLVRYPLLGGQPTYLCGFAHLLLVGLATVLIGGAIRELWRNLRERRRVEPHDSALWVRSLFVGSGIAMTLTGMQIRRYYIAAAFPLDVLSLLLPTLAWGAKRPRLWRAVLATGFVAQAVVSGSFVAYIHDHAGAPQGDYGLAYHLIQAGKK